MNGTVLSNILGLLLLATIVLIVAHAARALLHETAPVWWTVHIVSANGEYGTMTSTDREEAERWGTGFADLWPDDIVMLTEGDI